MQNGKQNQQYKIADFLLSETIASTNLRAFRIYLPYPKSKFCATVMFSKVIFLLALAFVGSINAQITYLPVASVVAAWTGTASPVEEGNGVYISPDGALAVVVSKDASVKAFNSLDGTVLWTVAPPSTTAQSFGGAFFCYGASQYIYYSYVDANVRYGKMFVSSVSFLVQLCC